MTTPSANKTKSYLYLSLIAAAAVAACGGGGSPVDSTQTTASADPVPSQAAQLDPQAEERAAALRAPSNTWVTVAAEGASFFLNAPSNVRYEAEPTPYRPSGRAASSGSR